MLFFIVLAPVSLCNGAAFALVLSVLALVLLSSFSWVRCCHSFDVGAALVVLMGQVLPSIAVGAALVVLMGQVLPSFALGAALVVLMG